LSNPKLKIHPKLLLMQLDVVTVTAVFYCCEGRGERED